MKQMKLVFIFPENIVEEPVTYHLIADYGVRVNILRASINPGKQGRMARRAWIFPKNIRIE